MIDTFVLLAPIYLLGVIALLGFVGCGFTAGYIQPDGPILRCTASDQTVDLDWDALTDATQYQVYRGDNANLIPLGDPVDAQTLTFHDPGLTNGKHYWYAVKAFKDRGDGELVWTDYSNTVDALPLGPFVKTVDTSLATFGVRDGFCGMHIRVVGGDLTVYTLGRTIVGLTTAHPMKVVDAQTKQDMGAALIGPNSRQVGEFRYDKLAQPVVLKGGLEYYILTTEMTSGDQFYGRNTVVTTRPEAEVKSAVYADPTAPGGYVEVAGAGNTIGPVSFEY